MLRKFLLFGLLAGSILSCKKMDIPLNGKSEARTTVEQTSTSTATLRHIGDPNRSPNLKIVEKEYDWSGYYQNGWAYGILANNPYLSKITVSNSYLSTLYDAPIGEQIWVATYRCPIENTQPQEWSDLYQDWSKNDFVVCRSCDGFYDSVYQGYDYPGLIKVAPFKDGELAGKDNKLSFWFADNAHKIDFDDSKRNWIYQTGDTMCIYARSGDEYNTHIKIPSHLTNGELLPDEGYYAFVINVNPDLLITETNYSDNVSILPFKVTGTTAVIDPSATMLNMPKPVTDLKGVFNGKGKYKTVTLTWTSKSEEYCVFRNGVMIMHDAYSSTTTNGAQQYIDTVGSGFKSAEYKIQAGNEGIGKIFSTPITVTSR